MLDARWYPEEMSSVSIFVLKLMDLNLPWGAVDFFHAQTPGLAPSHPGCTIPFEVSAAGKCQNKARCPSLHISS